MARLEIVTVMASGAVYFSDKMAQFAYLFIILLLSLLPSLNGVPLAHLKSDQEKKIAVAFSHDETLDWQYFAGIE